GLPSDPRQRGQPRKTLFSHAEMLEFLHGIYESGPAFLHRRWRMVPEVESLESSSVRRIDGDIPMKLLRKCRCDARASESVDGPGGAVVLGRPARCGPFDK